MTRSDDSLVTLLLGSRLCSEGVRPLKASEFWKLIDLIATERAAGSDLDSRVGSGKELATGLGALLGQSPQELVRNCALPEELAGRIVALIDRATAMAFELERLEQSGIKAVTAFDDHYPRQWLDRLGVKAPPLIYAVGAVELLDIPGLGVVGSRDVSQAGGDVAQDLAQCASRRGLPLVSGGARGVDQLAMASAFEAGGAVVGILAESLLRKLKRPEVRRAVHDGSTTFCTPYSPDAPFSAGNAMGRNKLIYAQSALTVVVASDADTGGTWSGATEALKRAGESVAVWRGAGEGPGNGLLQQRGAIAVSDLEAVESLLDAPNPSETQPVEPQASRVEQQALFSSVG